MEFIGSDFERLTIDEFKKSANLHDLLLVLGADFGNDTTASIRLAPGPSRFAKCHLRRTQLFFFLFVCLFVLFCFLSPPPLWACRLQAHPRADPQLRFAALGPPRQARRSRIKSSRRFSRAFQARFSSQPLS